MDNYQLTTALEQLTSEGVISSGWTSFGEGYELANGETVTEQQLSEAFAQHEEARIAAESVRHWPNVQSFMAEFLPSETHAIANSTIPEVITSRFLLSTWLGHVVSNDPLITQGLDILLHVGIITNERRQQIITVPT